MADATAPHRTGKLLRAEGAYRKGLSLTTDPAASWEPGAGRGPVFVDPARFDAWKAAGALAEDEAPAPPDTGAAAAAEPGERGTEAPPEPPPTGDATGEEA
jgi:hypothetical protein